MKLIFRISEDGSEESVIFHALIIVRRIYSFCHESHSFIATTRLVEHELKQLPGIMTV